MESARPSQPWPNTAVASGLLGQHGLMLQMQDAADPRPGQQQRQHLQAEAPGQEREGKVAALARAVLEDHFKTLQTVREGFKNNTIRLAVESSKRLRVPGTEVQSLVAILPNMFIRQEGVPHIYPVGSILQSIQPTGTGEQPGPNDLSLRLVVFTPWGQVSKYKDRLARAEVEFGFDTEAMMPSWDSGLGWVLLFDEPSQDQVKVFAGFIALRGANARAGGNGSSESAGGNALAGVPAAAGAAAASLDDGAYPWGLLR